MQRLNFMDWLTGALVALGGLNWGLIGFFKYDLLAKLFSTDSNAYRVIAAIVGLAAVYVVGAVFVRATGYAGSHAEA